MLQPPSALLSIMCFIYQTLGTRRSPCSCHSKIHQSDVIPLLPQQCNSPALTVLMDPLSSFCLWLWASLTGRGKSGRELATREQWPVRMSFTRRKKQNETPKQTRKSPGMWSFKTKPGELRSLRWHFWVGNETMLSQSLKEKSQTGKERQKICKWRKQASSPPF